MQRRYMEMRKLADVYGNEVEVGSARKQSNTGDMIDFCKIGMLFRRTGIELSNVFI